MFPSLEVRVQSAVRIRMDVITELQGLVVQEEYTYMYETRLYVWSFFLLPSQKNRLD